MTAIVIVGVVCLTLVLVTKMGLKFASTAPSSPSELAPASHGAVEEAALRRADELDKEAASHRADATRLLAGGLAASAKDALQAAAQRSELAQLLRWGRVRADQADRWLLKRL